MLNTIIHGDCLEVMQAIPDHSVDMIFCDLPFGTTRNSWDCIISLESLWQQYKRIIKSNGSIVLFAQSPFDKVLGASNLPMLRYEWIWEKDRATGHLNAKKMPMKAHENILVFYKKLPSYEPQMTIGEKVSNGTSRRRQSANYGSYKELPFEGRLERYPRSVVRFNTVNSAHGVLHETQKPVDLCEFMIKTYTQPGEVVLDNCIGSGTTAVAAINTGRSFIGIEKESKYVEIARKRIAETQVVYEGI